MVSKDSLISFIDSFFKLSIAMLLLVATGCTEDKTKHVSVPTEISSLNFNGGLTSGTSELALFVRYLSR